ncbi:unnamed protein product [Vitrella brassicaformis CCMP3155]|uniref:Uncharacterized protein n=1 Tax=Vitrella brassicaformis (strain CCMP3155) TaxID=1169540 RepID=A0A0G4EKA6_VITBC|nr:unnamed protein product [Vitrella brassicaformis CCMP3155]|eukprot:CEL97880.1 unnamed protein product [Vitrella brassicaformis CCMP3155]
MWVASAVILLSLVWPTICISREGGPGLPSFALRRTAFADSAKAWPGGILEENAAQARPHATSNGIFILEPPKLDEQCLADIKKICQTKYVYCDILQVEDSFTFWKDGAVRKSLARMTDGAEIVVAGVTYRIKVSAGYFGMAVFADVDISMAGIQRPVGFPAHKLKRYTSPDDEPVRLMPVVIKVANIAHKGMRELLAEKRAYEHLWQHIQDGAIDQSSFPEIPRFYPNPIPGRLASYLIIDQMDGIALGEVLAMMRNRK